MAGNWIYRLQYNLRDLEEANLGWTQLVETPLLFRSSLRNYSFYRQILNLLNRQLPSIIYFCVFDVDSNSISLGRNFINNYKSLSEVPQLHHLPSRSLEGLV